MRFRAVSTPLEGLTLLERLPLKDGRGFFERMYCAQELAVLGFNKPIAQINRSLTHHKGVVRGLHFQYPPHSEIKVVSCLKGQVFDVAVDLRRNSPTFLHWHGEFLSESNERSLLIPEGFAHGFQAMSDNCEITYFVSAPYQAAAEGGVNPVDPIIGIIWPLPSSGMSEKDAMRPYLDRSFVGLDL